MPLFLWAGGILKVGSYGLKFYLNIDFFISSIFLLPSIERVMFSYSYKGCIKHPNGLRLTIPPKLSLGGLTVQPFPQICIYVWTCFCRVILAPVNLVSDIFDIFTLKLTITQIANFVITILNQNLRVIAIILNWQSCFQSFV